MASKCRNLYSSIDSSLLRGQGLARSTKYRLLLVAGMTGYVAFFQWMYINYLDPTWAYFGFNYYRPSTKYVVLAWVLSLLPSLWMPIHLTRPSHLAYWVLYITVIIPSMFIPLFSGINTPTEISMLMIVFFIAFIFTGASYLFPLWPLRHSRLSPRVFWIFFFPSWVWFSSPGC